jgi:hypothetical protein
LGENSHWLAMSGLGDISKSLTLTAPANATAERFVGYENNVNIATLVKLFRGKDPNNVGDFRQIIANLIAHFNVHPLPEFDLEALEANMNICHEAAANMKLTDPASVQAFHESEIAALCLYTSHSDFYRVLNAALRMPKRDNLTPFVDIIWLILSAISKCPLYTSSDTLYRGVKADLTKELVIDKVVTWHSFTSCSTGLNTLNEPQFLGQSGHRSIFNIRMTTTRARDISTLSLFPGEKEVVFPPNTRFRVIDCVALGNDLTQYLLREEVSFDPILKYGDTPFQEYRAREYTMGNSSPATPQAATLNIINPATPSVPSTQFTPYIGAPAPSSGGVSIE